MLLLTFTMVMCIIVAVFAIQNAEIVPVKFFFYQQDASLVIVILGSVFLGLIIGASITTYVKLRQYWKNRKNEGIIKELTDQNLLFEKRIADLDAKLEEKEKLLLEKNAIAVEESQPNKENEESR